MLNCTQVHGDKKSRATSFGTVLTFVSHPLISKMFIKYLAVCVLLPHLLQAIIVFPEYEHMHVVGFSNNKRVCGPTVTKLENTFISSCKELKFKDCQGIYKDFSGAFAGRDPTTIRRE